MWPCVLESGVFWAVWEAGGPASELETMVSDLVPILETAREAE